LKKSPSNELIYTYFGFEFFMRIQSVFIFLIIGSLFSEGVFAQTSVKVRHRDRKKDIEFVTTEGTIVLRLSDSTPLHRDNFLRLVKNHFYDSLLFHRVIQYFMIQGGDPTSKRAPGGKPLGDGDLPYTVPAEFRVSLFHVRGVLAAAREGDDTNPKKASSATQFYIVQGKKYTDSMLDSVELHRLKRKIPEQQRVIYKTFGGTPFLDLNYTIFGEVVAGMEIVDKIAAVPASKGDDKDRPLNDVRILSAKLIKRKY